MSGGAGRRGTHCDGPKRPSPALAWSMALAAACPIAMPCLLREPSWIAPSDAAYSEESVARSPARPGNGAFVRCARDEFREHVVGRRCDGRVDRGLRARTLLEQIWLMVLPADRVDRVVDGALHHAHVDLECRWRTPVRPRERDERRRRDLVPVSHLTGVGSRGRCGRDAEHAEPAQERDDCDRDERDGSSARQSSSASWSPPGWVASWRPSFAPSSAWAGPQ